MSERPEKGDPAEHAATALEDAVARLRRRLTEPDRAEPIPESYVLMGTARLLEELARSLRAGQRPHEHVVDAAVELCDHITGRHTRR